jgi:GNAT superfamily N-acetyltransferase
MSETEIVNFQHEYIDQIKPLLAQSTFMPMRYLAKELNDELTSFWFNNITDLIREKGAQVFSTLSNREIMGMIVYMDNPWETSVLGKKVSVLHYFVINQNSKKNGLIAKQLLAYVINFAASHGDQLLVCKTYTDDIIAVHALEEQGFLLMDTVMDCYYDYRKFPLAELSRTSHRKDVMIRLGTKDDVEELVSIAHMSFQGHFGRYHADERIGKGKATRFYEEWIKSSAKGYADWICVAETDGRIAGYSIWKKPSQLEMTLKVRVGHYSIAGIHPDYFGCGLFTMLTYKGMMLLDGLADIVEGPTHINNYGVQLGYSKLHWRICSDARHSFHKWL